MTSFQKSRKDLEFQLRTPSPDGGTAVRSVRPHKTGSDPLDSQLQPLCAAPLRPMKITPSSPLSYSAKCTIPLHKGVGRISARSAVTFHPLSILLTAVPKIHRKRLPVLFRPDREGARGVTNRRHRRKGALGEFPRTQT